MKKNVRTALLLILILVIAACSQGKKETLLNPDSPITVTLWHYYNGNTKVVFDSLISEFNETIGMDRGIVVDAQSLGDVNQLGTAVFDAANKSIGALPMPDIFASYPDNAFRVSQIVPLVDLEQYFTREEIDRYRGEFLEEGRFITDNKYYILPIAKSSENLYVNKTAWEPFAEKHGFTEKDLSTWEGLVRVSEIYYKTTGKGFFGVDSNSNYMIIAGMQHGSGLFKYSQNGTASFNLEPDVARAIWNYFYTPYMNGYFAKSGRFSSDDAKIGTVLAYTGSTAGAAYFPTEVTLSENNIQEIEPLVLPYPHFTDGKPVAIQQGAGMCITKSDETHEYAATVFLKWFTETRQNLKFAVSTGYFPVTYEALNEKDDIIKATRENAVSPTILASFNATNIMFSSFTLYNSKPFHGSYDMRNFLEKALISKISADLETLKKKTGENEDKHELLSEFISEEAFNAWYLQIQNQAALLLKQ